MSIKLIKSTSFAFLAMIFDKLFLFILTILISRLAGSQALGLYGLFTSTTALMSGLSTGGMDSALTRYCSIYKKTEIARLFSVLKFIFIIFLAIIVIISINIHYFSNKISAVNLESPININKYLIIVFILQSTVLLTQSIVRGFEKFKALLNIIFIRSILLIPVSVACLSMFGLEGGLYVLVLYHLTWTILLIIQIRKIFIEYGVSYQGFHWRDITDNKEVLLFAVPFAMATISANLFNWLIRLIVANGDDGLHLLGIFTAVSQYSIVFTLLSGAFVSAVSPMLSAVHTTQDKWHELYSTYFSITLKLVLLILLVFMTLSLSLLEIFSISASQYTLFIKIMFCSLAFNAVIWVIGPVFTSKGEGFSYLLLCIIKYGVAFILIYVLYEKYKLYSIPFGFVIGDVAVMLLCYKYIFKLGFLLFDKPNRIITAIISFVFIPAMFLIGNSYLLLLGSVSTLLSIFLIFSFLDREQKNLIVFKIPFLRRFD